MAKTYQIIMNYPAHTTYDGVPVEEKTVEKTIPFGLHETVYYAYKKTKEMGSFKNRYS